jgi:hypothetical protein
MHTDTTFNSFKYHQPTIGRNINLILALGEDMSVGGHLRQQLQRTTAAYVALEHVLCL